MNADTLWVDQNSGYFYCQELPNSVIWNPFTSDVISLKRRSTHYDTRYCFINCGGTIVSTPTKNSIGVAPCNDLLENPGFNDFLKKNRVNYEEFSLKLSEEWLPLDYLNLKKRLIDLRKQYTNFIFTYGTDYVSFFAPWVDLLSKQLNFKAIICVGQRSLDRPTSEFDTLINAAIIVLKKMHSRNCFVLTYDYPSPRVHNAYELKKYHTTSKTGFYSKNSKYLEENLKKLSLSFKEKIVTVNELSQLKKVDLGVETCTYTPDRTELRINRGVGNSKKSYLGQTHCTSTCSGPVNPYLYNNISKDHLFSSDFQFSWESCYVLKAFKL